MATSLGAITFNTTYNMLVDTRAQIRFKKQIIAKALTVGVMKSRDYDDRGIAAEMNGNLRYLTADDLGLQIGDVIEFAVGGGDWRKARISGKVDVGGMTRIDIEGENER